MVYENQIPKTETVYELKNEIPSFKEFMRSYEHDANLNYDDLNSGDISEVKGYGPCKNSSCDCYCSASECICNNYSDYGHGGHSKKSVKITEKTRIRGFQHLIHTGNDYSDRNYGPRTLRGELWDGDVSVSVDSSLEAHSIRSSAGVNAGLGGVIASGGASYSLLRTDGPNRGDEARVLSGTIGGEAGVGPGGATLGYTLAADVVGIKAKGFSANVGVDVGSGVAIGAGGVEAKVAGVGISIGKKMGFSTPFGGASVDLEEACVIQ